jgi:hypothetical protein
VEPQVEGAQRNDRPIPRSGFASALSTSSARRSLLTESLRAAPFEAYFWETPPLSRERADAPFEFVVVDSRALASIVADRVTVQAFLCACRALSDEWRARGRAPREVRASTYRIALACGNRLRAAARSRAQKGCTMRVKSSVKAGPMGSPTLGAQK